jgi:hypothetical protein
MKHLAHASNAIRISSAARHEHHENRILYAAYVVDLSVDGCGRKAVFASSVWQPRAREGIAAAGSTP